MTRMAATMHAKLNWKKLDKLNIIKICEQILNPSVPMALRLSGILMVYDKDGGNNARKIESGEIGQVEHH